MNYAEFNEQISFDNPSLSDHVWGDELIKATRQLLLLPQLIEDVERAKANSEVNN